MPPTVGEGVTHGTSATADDVPTPGPRRHWGIYSLAVDDPSDDLHSVFVDWPFGVAIDEPEVRFVRRVDGLSTTWVEVGRIPHPPGPDRLFARIEVLFRRPT